MFSSKTDEMLDLRASTNQYLQKVAILEVQTVAGYEGFTKATVDKDLKPALKEANERYSGLD